MFSHHSTTLPQITSQNTSAILATTIVIPRNLRAHIHSPEIHAIILTRDRVYILIFHDIMESTCQKIYIDLFNLLGDVIWII